MAKRQPKMFCLIGEPGSGKTQRQIAHIKARVAAGDRAIVIDPEGGEDAWNQFIRINDPEQLRKFLNFKGVVVVPWVKGQTFRILRELAESKKLTNYMMVLDDPGVYAVPDPEDDLRYFLKRKRQGGIDFFTNSHSWMEVPAVFCRFIDFWEIGPASGSPQERAKEIGSKQAAANIDKWQAMANANAAESKRKGVFHLWYGCDKYGKHPKTGEVPK
jgi:hypothetical protein